IGGEFFKQVYDEKIPGFLRKYGKKWGAKIGETEIDRGVTGMGKYVGPELDTGDLNAISPKDLNATQEKQIRDIGDAMEEDGISFKEAMQKYGSIGLAEIVGGKMERARKLISVHSFTIPPEMSRAIRTTGQAVMESEVAYGSKEKADATIQSIAETVEKACRTREALPNRGVPDNVQAYESGVAKALARKKRIDFRGYQLREGKEAQDIADLFQVYRSPKQEILHAIYTDPDGRILAHNAITSGQLDYVSMGDITRYLHGIKDTAKRLGAAKVHFMHNHPSGNVAMSRDDMRMGLTLQTGTKQTSGLQDIMGDFIVIDHGKFSYVGGLGFDPGPHTGTYKVKPGLGNWMTKRGVQLRNQEDVASFAAGLQYDKTKACFIYLNSQNQVMGWSVHDKRILMKGIKSVEDTIRQQAKAHDARYAVIIADGETLLNRIVRSGFVGDWLLDVQDSQGVSYRLAQPGRFRMVRKPTKKAYALFEPEAPYGERPLSPGAQKLLNELEALKTDRPAPVHKMETPAGKVGTIYNNVAANWRTRTVDRLYPLMQKLDKGLDITDPDAQAYIQGRMDASAPTVIATFLQHGKLKWLHNAPFVGTHNKGFLPLVEEYGTNRKAVDSYDTNVQILLKGKIGYKPKNIRDIDRYLFWKVASRAEKLTKEGREHLFTKDDIALLKRIANKDWAGTALDKQYVDFNKNILDFAQEIGIIDPSMRKVWEHDEYIPFYRILEDKLLGEEFLRAPFKTRKFIDSQIKKLIGGTEKLGDPFENVLRNWSHLITESIRNRSRVTAYKYMERLGYAEPS
ncbi:MAG: hypothetical protein JRI41_10565, partial [Deltaproteobacteria bacterium]|nr:hypothetical protein [Deltaproteobacteria bacterium]